MTLAPSPSTATPIFDEVDRWWRDGVDEPAPTTMLSFTRSVGAGPDTGATWGVSPEPRYHGLAGASV